MILPIGALSKLTEYLKTRKLQVNISQLPTYNIRTFHGNIDDVEDRDYQTKLIDYLVNDPNSMRGLQLQTGKGKTYCAIRAMLELGFATIIIVPSLVDQWEEQLRLKTDLRDEQIYIIRQHKTIKTLFKGGIKPDVFVASIDTLRAFAKENNAYKELGLTYEQFLKYYNIGTKIIDEAHLNFHTVTQLDLRSEVPHNLYLSATFFGASGKVGKIFDIVFPESMRHNALEYDRYVNVTSYSYGGEIMERFTIREKGYNHARYEGEMLKKDWKFKHYMTTVLTPIINMHYVNIKRPGEKMIVLCSTVQMIKTVTQYLREYYYDLDVVSYAPTAGDPISNLYGLHDIIVACPKGCGTGKDIANLRTVVNTISQKTPIGTTQILGRLRKLDGVTPEYVEVWD
jgi:superfamily II DNA or RNA helicase